MLPSNGKQVKQSYNLHMTVSEWKIIMKHVKKNCSMKWFVYLNLLSFRGLRPMEACAINIMDFSDDFSKLTFREAKTNKLRTNEHIIPELAKLIKTYVSMNSLRLRDGYLFPFYTKRSQGMPYMVSHVASTWFSSDIRKKLKKIHPAFNEWHPVYTKKVDTQKRYRIGLYSFRRFFETYIYVKNNFAPMSTALIKEIMEYNSKFDPVKHYIKLVHHEEQKAGILNETLSPLARYIVEGQKTLSEYG